MKIYNIFRSIDGEVNAFGQGTYTTFIRFAGCNLSCAHCDTSYARSLKVGTEIEVEGILESVKELGCHKVTITGGEPLMQPEAFKLLTNALRGNDFRITVETNGSVPLMGMGIDGWVVDYKLPSSGMHKKMVDNNFASLRPIDFIKFVVLDKKDFRYAVEVKRTIEKTRSRARFAFSPMYGELPPMRLFSWLEEAKIFDAVLNIQLHKLIGLP
jgi:7-carboxy-7-deazaguanine synthase